MAILSDENLKKHTDAVSYLSGDFAEIGVFKAATFKRLAPLAEKQNKVAHGFDSFCGMDDPTEKDCGYYEKGRLSCGGIDAFRAIMNQAKVDPLSYGLFKGFIPTCFDDIGDKQEYSFVLVDVDQYKPTLVALPWVWQRLQVGGILVMDDYFKNREGVAACAIDEWLRTLHPLDFCFIEYTDTQLVIRKMYISDSPLPSKNK